MQFEDQALAAAELTNIIIDQGNESTSLTLEFEVPWDEEHGMRFIFVDNEFVEVE